jgi:RimJ/RimL family protein N-acetyltransferase
VGSLRWFATHGMETVEVGTQLRNIPAARLYESLGFRLAGASLTLRKIL